MRQLFNCVALALIVGGCAQSENSSDAPEMAEPASAVAAKADLADAEGMPKGTVTLTERDGGLTLALALNGLEPGEKAFHLHTTGQCDAPDFKSAGGHLNPFGKTHGSLSDDGPHLGDFANIEISGEGTVDATREIEGVPSELYDLMFDEDGTAVMIHAGPDDYASDPAGAAGPRIACGVLEKTS